MTAWPAWLLALIDVLAVHRLTRLVTDDLVTLPFRWMLIRRSYRHANPAQTFPDGGDLDEMVDADMIEEPADVPRLAVLVRCRWCSSVYIAAAAVLAHQTIPDVWLPVAAVLALSSAAALLARLED